MIKSQTSHYLSNHKLGIEYQDYLVSTLRAKYNIHIDLYESDWDQLHKGESPQGMEIKLNQKCHEYNELWIECAEKSNPSITSWTPSGIYARNTNSFLYAIGNYQEVFIFTIQTLRTLAHDPQYRRKITATSKAYLLPLSEARKYAQVYKLSED